MDGAFLGMAKSVPKYRGSCNFSEIEKQTLSLNRYYIKTRIPESTLLFGLIRRKTWFEP